GLSIANGKLYIADTNNHAIRVVDLKTKQTSTLNIQGLQPPTSPSNIGAPETEDGPNAEEIKLAPQSLRASSDAALVIQVELPRGYHLNPAAPQRYRISIETGPPRLGLLSDTQLGAIGQDKVVGRSAKNLQLPLRIPIRTFEPGNAEVRLQLTLFYCREDNTGTCRIKTLVWRVPVEITSNATAGKEITVQGKLIAD
ncbi:MAG: hypothetical protein M3Y84_01785, partial [Acidobacteriota bacterium]|nr:hypothetical protein [Acidobacteriota bacterium]